MAEKSRMNLVLEKSPKKQENLFLKFPNKKMEKKNFKKIGEKKERYWISNTLKHLKQSKEIEKNQLPGIIPSMDLYS